MATSQRSRVRTPESVQFWLCVGAVSLGLHSGLLFGLQRWATVTIAQPDEGPIAVELVDAPDVNASDTVVSRTEPAAIASIPQKPDAQPEVKLDVKPEPEPNIVAKPEPSASETPIVPKPKAKPKPSSSAPTKAKPSTSASPKPNSGSPSPVDQNSTTPVTSNTELPPTEITGVRSVDVREESVPEQENSRGDMPGNDDPTSELKLNPHPQLSISQSSPLFPVGKSATISVQFAAICPVSTGTVCDPTQVKLQRTKDGASYNGPAPNLSSKDLGEIDNLATKIISQASVKSLTIETTTPKKTATFWSITFQIR